MKDIPQFGEPPEKYTDRPGVYAILIKDGKLLTLTVNGEGHLPGGGIDEDEDAEKALIREVREETGCEIANLRFIGRANQFFAESKTGPLNKLGAFYRADIVSQDAANVIEADHHITWVPLDVADTTLSSEYQKWAVRRVLEEK